MTSTNEVSIKQVVGGGYNNFWRFKGRYRVVKGSRASKKSKTTALNIIYRMMKYEGANTLVIRKTYRTLKDSFFSELVWAINRLKVSKHWTITKSPLEMVYKPFGTKILFRGLDDPLKVTSITVETGDLCWLILEEAYEIMNEDNFNMLDESIRGKTSGDLFKQITIIFNPWNERHWLKSRFFDVTNDDILAMTTNYKCNEFLDDADRRLFERMKIENPRRYQVAGLGHWGVVEGLVFENWREERFDVKELVSGNKKLKSVFGLDFGYTNDPAALFCGLVDKENKKLYVFDEMYEKGMSNEMISKEIKNMGYQKERIIADSVEPKSIDRLKVLGLRVKGSTKGKDSINVGIDYIQDYEIIIHPRCVNFLTEISNYMYEKDKFGKTLNRPIDDFNHLMDAMRYALSDDIQEKKARVKSKARYGF